MSALLSLAADAPLEDPTRPPNLGGVEITAPEISAEIQEFKLTTILHARGRVFAVINGQRVEVGDSVSGARVVEIRTDHVKIDADDGPVELRLGSASLRRKPKEDPSNREESP